MKATFALLPPREVQNAASTLAWEIHRRFGVGVGARRLPPHISLKQPFPIGEDLPTLLSYMKGLVAQTPPVTITPGAFYVWETVFGVEVRETVELRGLHERLNRELPGLFGDTHADHDGAGYRFHLTLAFAGGDAATYQDIHAAFRTAPIPPPFAARELGLFVYSDAPNPATGQWEYLMHTALPLTGTMRGTTP